MATTLTHALLDRVEQDLNVLIRDLTPPDEGAFLKERDRVDFANSSTRILTKALAVQELIGRTT